MDDTCQIDLPESFTALYVRPGRSKPNIPWEDLYARYELCEAMATMLQDTSSRMLHELRITEQVVLERCYLGLCQEGQPFTKPESVWIVRRLAEIINYDDAEFVAFIDSQETKGSAE